MTPSTPIDQEKYQAVRAKVIEACPELMELTFGCCLRDPDEPNEPNEYLTVATPENEDQWLTAVYSRIGRIEGVEMIDDYEIIGHPIRLSHVLRTIRRWQRPAIHVLPDGTFMWRAHWKQGYSHFSYGSTWNLKNDDLSLQNAETISFLYDVLYG